MLVMSRFEIYVLFICAALCHVAMGGCLEDVQKDQRFKDCMAGYKTFIQEGTQAGGNVPTLICSAEGQAAMGCFFEFGSQCPDLLLSQNINQEQVTAMCNQAGGLEVFSKTCMDAQNCLTLSMTMDGMQPNETKTKFGYVPQLMKQICGTFTEVFRCITPQVETECTMIANGVRNISAMIQLGMPPGLMFPKYDTLRMLANENCPTLPKDFGVSPCTHDNLQTQMFEDCITRVNTNYSTPVKRLPAPVGARLTCLSETLVVKCGKEHYNGIVNNAQYFFTDEPLKCERGSAAFAQLSLMASFFALLFVLIMS